ncbi:unnamed protein product [Strongylus vulgaris]|uniref:Reverse transcriptase domain-containing protein n=1 Tax=Strongylus vulgaris TaxID=40348 RepID=A0A3P7ITF0_STRVU|nr:unnamed protein product [Strongylus vulgaris]
MDSTTKRFYTNFFRWSKRSVSNLVIPTGGIPPRILPAEVCSAIQTMKAATAPGPDHISANLLRAGGYRLEILVELLTSYLLKERIPDQWRTSQPILFRKKGEKEYFRNYYKNSC